jgi:ribosome assembly protein YihI (activator of Der GTPase)
VAKKRKPRIARWSHATKQATAADVDDALRIIRDALKLARTLSPAGRKQTAQAYDTLKSLQERFEADRLCNKAQAEYVDDLYERIKEAAQKYPAETE